MFKMIGGDGREYGPVTADQLREWIADNRANAQTLIQPEGSQEWVPLGSVAEFADVFAPSAAAPRPASPEPPPPPIAPTWTDALRRDYRLDVGRCLGLGWQLVMRHFLLVASASALVWGIYTAGSFDCMSFVLSRVIGGALHGGLMLVFLKLIREQPTRVGDVFACFGLGFVQLMIVWIATRALSQVGLVFCLLPGLYLKVIWVFALPLVADRGLGWLPALELSRQMVSRHWFRVAVLMAVAYLPVILFTLYNAQQTGFYFMEHFGDSWATFRWDAFAKHLNEFSVFARKLELEQQVVVLLNLPFAYGAILQAYESIFGERQKQTP